MQVAPRSSGELLEFVSELKEHKDCLAAVKTMLSMTVTPHMKDKPSSVLVARL